MVCWQVVRRSQVMMGKAQDATFCGQLSHELLQASDAYNVWHRCAQFGA